VRKEGSVMVLQEWDQVDRHTRDREEERVNR
jgi:hypothetical protein